MDRFAVNLVKTSKGKSMPLGIGKKKYLDFGNQS